MTAPLYDVPHPYHGAEAERDYITEFETLDELESWLSSYDEDMNFVYRWDWDVEQGVLSLFVVLQRKSRFLNLVCPVTEADEPRVREFLTSDRILGALRRTWAPLLDPPPGKPTKWWRVVAPDKSLWAQTSSESDARRRIRPGDTLQRLHTAIYSEWKDVR